MRNAACGLYFHLDSEDEDNLYFSDFKENIIAELHEAFFSLREPSRPVWHHDEIEVVLQNQHAEVCISEYNGIVWVGLVPRTYYDYYNAALSDKWLELVSKRFCKIVEEYRPGDKLVAGPRFSNGEQIFHTAEVEKKSQTISSKEGVLDWM